MTSKFQKSSTEKIKLEILDGLKELMADGKLETKELDFLRPEIDAHLYPAGSLPAVENETLEKTC